MKNCKITRIRKLRNLYKEEKIGYLFVMPTLIFLLLIMIFPLGYATFLSFFNVHAHMDLEFIGINNYLTALKDPNFWNSVSFTILFTIISVITHMLLGFILAFLLTNNIKWKGLFRFLLLIPWMVSQVVAGVIWRWILNAQYGVGNDIFVKLGFIKQYLPWLADPTLSKISVIVAYTWQCLPFVMIMLYAGMQTIPIEQYEASEVDGANFMQKIFHITIPNLKYIILITSLMDFIWAFRCFDLPQIMTNGGPLRSTELLSIFIYKNTFEYFKFGYASAIAVLMLLMVLAFSLIYTKIVLKGD